MTPVVSTWCMEALTRLYCTLSPLACRRAFIIRYPEWGCLDLISLTHWSNSSSVIVLYNAFTERSDSAMRRYTVRLDIPKSLAIHGTDRLSSRSLLRYSGDMTIRCRPAGPCSNCTTAMCCSLLSFSILIRLCSCVSESKIAGQTVTWLDTAFKNTSSCVQVNSKKSRSRGMRPRICSNREQSLSKRWLSKSS